MTEIFELVLSNRRHAYGPLDQVKSLMNCYSALANNTT